MGLLLGSREQQIEQSEAKQTVFRLVIVSVALAFVSVLNIWAIKFDKLSHDDILCQAVMVLSWLFCLTMLILRRFQRDSSQFRIVVGLVHDVTVTTLFLIFFKEKMAFFLFLYLWITIGHGFRFGEKYLMIAALFTSLGLLALFKLNPVWGKLAPISFDLGVIFVLVASYTGYLLRELKIARDKIESIATRDPLTGLSNRRIVEDRLPLILQATRDKQQTMGVIFFDLDGFKPINDRLGHETGDRLLKLVAETAQSCVRSTDIVARMGGDEFLVVLKGIESESSLKERAKALLHSIQSIQHVKGKSVKISASLGCVFIGTNSPLDKNTSQRVLREADRLMYVSKRSSKAGLENARISVARSGEVRNLAAS